jgi:membrane-associated phospholipid phosphatase
MRGLGVTEAFDALPDAVRLVFAVLTQLADVWFVLGLLTLIYWFGERSPLSLPREHGALLVALAFGALSLIIALKQFFTLPRPPLAGEATALEHVPAFLHGAYTNAATATGYGFPSGHALTATVVWGGLATVLGVGTRARRILVAGTIVAVVCLARLVLGVHYLVDVLAGVALGLAYLGTVLTLAHGRARRAFWIAAAVAVVALFGTVSADSALALGATAGALVAWEVVGDRASNSGPIALGVGVLGMAVLGGGFVAVYLLDVGVVVTALTSAVVGAGVVVMPVLGERLDRRKKDGSAQNVSR